MQRKQRASMVTACPEQSGQASSQPPDWCAGLRRCRLSLTMPGVTGPVAAAIRSSISSTQSGLQTCKDLQLGVS